MKMMMAASKNIKHDKCSYDFTINLLDKPVIGVPCSTGYGANFGGVTALLSMLNSCASGVSVVNIDNGFGAACQASLINQVKGKREPKELS